MSDFKSREIVVKTFSKDTLGIQDTNERWYNINPKLTQALLNDAKKNIAELGRGDTIELFANFEHNKYNNFNIIKKSDKKNWAEDMNKLEDLLTDAHKKFKKFSIKTEKIEVDLDKKYALFKAIVECSLGTFEAHGDATMENIEMEKVKLHFIRMAESRAIVRVLRLATNNAAVAEEELEDGEDTLEDG